MKTKISGFVYWTPRILSILFVLFLMLFSLDVFGNGYTFWQTVLGLIMHNIPAFILLAVLIISWKREIVGGIVFTLAGLLYCLLTVIRAQSTLPLYMVILWALPIAFPALLIGILFLVGWKKKRAGAGHKKK
ncbi:MAG: hypothetical protein V1735_07925 [Nanoarchaeota archaeon]